MVAGFTRLGPGNETTFGADALIHWSILSLSMRRLASFVAIFILLTAAAPLLACMTGSAMTKEESACCRSMHGKCGDMAKMGCCRTEARTDHHPQLATTGPAIDVPLAAFAWLAPVLTTALPLSRALLQAPDEHSPPGLLAATFIVLRI
jgi:hypothetical protein